MKDRTPAAAYEGPRNGLLCVTLSAGGTLALMEPFLFGKLEQMSNKELGLRIDVEKGTCCLNRRR